MKTSVIHALLFAGMVAALAGCQSAGRWAWWKRGNADNATTVVENSAAPTLPSASATPHAVMPAGLEPAASPSASNLASTGVAAGAAQVSVPSLTAPSTNASTNALSTSSLVPGVPTIPGASPTQQVAAAPATGPYDPNGYKPSTTAGATGTSALGDLAAVADRYGIASADRYSTPASTSPQPSGSEPGFSNIAPVAAAPATPDNRYGAVAASQTSSSAAQDRYATTSAPGVTSAADRYSQMFAQPAANDVGKDSPATSTSQEGQSTTAIAQTTSPTSQIETSKVTATVQLKSPAGQYRPGGTSSYTIAPVQHVEVATRPEAPGSSQVPAASAPATTGSQGSTPAVPALPATGTGSRTY